MKFYILEFIGACIKIEVAKNKWQDLYKYSIDKAHEYGFKAYQYNIFTKYLSDEQKQKIQKFFRGDTAMFRRKQNIEFFYGIFIMEI